MSIDDNGDNKKNIISFQDFKNKKNKKSANKVSAQDNEALGDNFDENLMIFVDLEDELAQTYLNEIFSENTPPELSDDFNYFLMGVKNLDEIDNEENPINPLEQIMPLDYLFSNEAILEEIEIMKELVDKLQEEKDLMDLEISKLRKEQKIK